MTANNPIDGPSVAGDNEQEPQPTSGTGAPQEGAKKPILCLDFDGVIHSYTSGWRGADVIPDPPVPGAMEFIARASEHFAVHVFSSRSHQPGGIEAMQNWLRDHMIEAVGIERTTKARVILSTAKPSAMVTLDDRAITFNGEWPDISSLLEFKPWNKRPVPVAASGAGAETDAEPTDIAAVVDRRPELSQAAGIWATAVTLDSHEAAIEVIDAALRAATARADRAEAALTRLRELPAKMRGIKAISGRPHAYIKGIERGLQLAAEEVEAALRSAASPAAATQEGDTDGGN